MTRDSSMHSQADPTPMPLYERAKRVLPGGVNSPVRAFLSVGGTPYFVERAQGSKVWDAEGNDYLDYVQSYGASILGHADPTWSSAVPGPPGRAPRSARRPGGGRDWPSWSASGCPGSR